MCDARDALSIPVTGFIYRRGDGWDWACGELRRGGAAAGLQDGGDGDGGEADRACRILQQSKTIIGELFCRGSLSGRNDHNGSFGDNGINGTLG